MTAPPTTAVASVAIAEAPLDGTGWAEYAAAHPAATFFHQPGWLEVVRRTFRYKHASIVARRGERVVGFLPLFLVPTLPWGRSLISTPQAVYGGPIADDDEARSALVDHASRLAEGRGASFLELRNEIPIPGLAGKDLYVTFRRPILPDADQNMAAIPRNQRRSIRVAQKHGLTARVGHMDLLDGFYHVYSESVRNLGTPVFPRALFANILERFGDDAFILGIDKGGQLLSAVLTFRWRDQILPYYGGATREGIQFATNDFMYWSLLLNGMERGLQVFDFGRSKVDSGSYHFKRHWGFEPTPLAYQYHLPRGKALPDLSPRNPKFSVAIKLWRKLPLRLTQWVGPHLVRYFP
ncbi:MAG TPA: FemAB family XrtA/PEP-CTERM system-associated protein [Candidatus Eisenbacteria bacterium]|nr:FemAB family XrtA/PEP-CTERM system-associated protein [Candidatus Eisenbacteria bacterium]